MRGIFTFLLVLYPFASYASASEPLSAALQKEACEFALASKSDMSDFTQYLGWIDVNNDGRDEHITFTPESADAKSLKITLPDGGALPELAIPSDYQEEFTLQDVQNRRWLRFKNHTFLLAKRNTENAWSSLWYIRPGNDVLKLCTGAQVKKVKTARPDYNFKTEFDVDQLCENVARHRNMNYIQPHEIDPVDIDLNLSARGEVDVDMNHDGASDPAYYVQYAFAGEKTCGFHYFLLKADIHTNGDEDAPLSPLGNQLYWAQHARPEDSEGKVPPMPCESLQDSQLFTFENRVFLERGDLMKSLEDAGQLYHQVWYFKDGKRYNLCHFDMRTQKVLEIVPLPEE